MAENQQLFGQFRTLGSQEFQGDVLLVDLALYQIHPQFTRMVKETPFCGLKMNALNTWRLFQIFLSLFLHAPTIQTMCGSPLHLSLAGDTKDWYKCLEPNSITRAPLKMNFLERFYPTFRTQDWRKKIASFT